MSATGRPSVRLRGPSLGVVELFHGDLIGRLPSAALFLDDPRVSEAHALVSLRGGRLWMLALRRLLGEQGRPVAEVLLAPGVEIELAFGLTLTVDAVSLPDRVLALAAPGQPTRPLGQVLSIVDGPPASALASYVPGAAAHLWTVGPICHLQRGAEPARSLVEGDTFTAAGLSWRLGAVPLGAAEHAPTHGTDDDPLRIVAHYDSVVVQRPRHPALVIGGTGARVLSELVTRAAPVAWETLAREVWTDDAATLELRHRWDVTLGRLRDRLRRAGIRRELVRADRTGLVHLALGPHDVAVDQA